MNLKEVVFLDEALTLIGTCAFQECASLQTIRIPKNVQNVGGSAFRGCTSLVLEHIGAAAFHDVSSLVAFDIPSSVRTGCAQ